MCAEVKRENAGEVWGDVGGGLQFEGEISPKGRGEEVRLKGAENYGWELHDAWVAGPCAGKLRSLKDGIVRNGECEGVGVNCAWARN